MSKNIKKFVSFILVLALSMAVSLPAFAAKKITTKVSAPASSVETETVTPSKVSDSITSNTIVTDSNIYEVLTYLGINLSKVKISENTDNSTKQYTVKDLENMMQQSRSKAKTYNETHDSKNEPIANQTHKATLTPSASGSMTLTSTDDYPGDFQLTYKVVGNYSGTSWTGASNAGVSIKNEAFATTWAIDSASSSVNYTSSVITLGSTTIVGDYLTIGVGSLSYTVEINQLTVNATNYFYASSYL